MQIKSLRPLVEDGSQCELIFDNGHKITIKPSNKLWDRAHAEAELLPYVEADEDPTWQEQIEARLSAVEAALLRSKTNLERAIEDEKRKREDAEYKLAEAQEVPEAEESDFKFKVPFLQSERLVAEDLAQTDVRLIKEYESLELRRPLDPVPDARWRLLRSNLFEFVG